MTLTRLLSLVAVAALSLTTSAVAGSHGRPPLAGGLPLDPELLPANSGPGDCVVRRMTGPGGAYRWERIECASQSSWGDRNSWGYGRHRLDVETRDGRSDCGCDRYGYDDRYAYGDGYGDYRQRSAVYDRRVEDYEYGQSRAYDSGYVGSGYVGGGYATGGYAGGGYAGGGYVSGGYSGGGYPQQGYGGYAYGDGYGQYGRREDRYGPGPAYVDYGYGGAAGRDQDGYLVWPGKLP